MTTSTNPSVNAITQPTVTNADQTTDGQPTTEALTMPTSGEGVSMTTPEGPKIFSTYDSIAGLMSSIDSTGGLFRSVGLLSMENPSLAGAGESGAPEVDGIPHRYEKASLETDSSVARSQETDIQNILQSTSSTMMQAGSGLHTNGERGRTVKVVTQPAAAGTDQTTHVLSTTEPPPSEAMSRMPTDEGPRILTSYDSIALGLLSSADTRKGNMRSFCSDLPLPMETPSPSGAGEVTSAQLLKLLKPEIAPQMSAKACLETHSFVPNLTLSQDTDMQNAWPSTSTTRKQAERKQGGSWDFYNSREWGEDLGPCEEGLDVQKVFQSSHEGVSEKSGLSQKQDDSHRVALEPSKTRDWNDLVKRDLEASIATTVKNHPIQGGGGTPADDALADANLLAAAAAAFGRVAKSTETKTELSKPPKKRKNPTPSLSTMEEQPHGEVTSSKEYIEPSENDVLLGRGGRTNNHPGNKKYLEAKDSMQERYLAADKNGKTPISQELVEIVKGWGGRFLKLDSSANRWYEIDDSTARKKCSQTLREVNTAEERAAKRAKYSSK